MNGIVISKTQDIQMGVTHYRIDINFTYMEPVKTYLFEAPDPAHIPMPVTKHVNTSIGLSVTDDYIVNNYSGDVRYFLTQQIIGYNDLDDFTKDYVCKRIAMNDEIVTATDMFVQPIVPTSVFAPTRDPAVSKLPGLNEIVKHPLADTEATLQSVIISLNDLHRWTVNEIADWLDTLDIDLRLKADDGTVDELPDANPCAELPNEDAYGSFEMPTYEEFKAAAKSIQGKQMSMEFSMDSMDHETIKLLFGGNYDKD